MKDKTMRVIVKKRCYYPYFSRDEKAGKIFFTHTIHFLLEFILVCLFINLIHRFRIIGTVLSDLRFIYFLFLFRATSSLLSF